MTTLKYEFAVKNFTCPNCEQFSDEISSITESFSDTTITALCCDTEFWQFDLAELGYDVIENTYA